MKDIPKLSIVLIFLATTLGVIPTLAEMQINKFNVITSDITKNNGVYLFVLEKKVDDVAVSEEIQLNCDRQIYRVDKSRGTRFVPISNADENEKAAIDYVCKNEPIDFAHATPRMMQRYFDSQVVHPLIMDIRTRGVVISPNLSNQSQDDIRKEAAARLRRINQGKERGGLAAHTYVIGDAGPAGGIVFEIDDTKQNGLEAAPVDQGSAPWGCQGTTVPGASETAVGSGAANTAAIVAGCSQAGIAAKIADDYSLNGYDDWYLPSKDELALLIILKIHQDTIVGGFANAEYWSSTEEKGGHDKFKAWCQDFTYGDQCTTTKGSTLRVRAVRVFLGTIEARQAEIPKQTEQQVTLEVTPPDIKVGDVFIIESTNPLHPENNSKTERTVISTEGDVIEVAVINLSSKSGKKRVLKFNNEWNLIATRNADNSGLDYSPPLKYFGFPLSPGKTWQQTSTETNIKTGTIRKHKISGVVGDWEDITVPAGTFHAIKVILNTEVVNPVTGEKSTGTDISWYAPNAKRSVKSEVTSRNEVDNTEQKSIAQLISFNPRRK